MSDEKQKSIPRLLEISQQEFCDHIEDDDFFLAYGNPVVINCDSGSKVVAIAWPMAERMLRMTGRGDEADEVIRQAAEMKDDSGTENAGEIKYWICQFEMSEKTKQEFDSVCTAYELTPDELFEAAIKYALHRAKTDPEGIKKSCAEAAEASDSDIRLIRIYPVYKGETEAQALKRKLAEEAAENNENDKDQ